MKEQREDCLKGAGPFGNIHSQPEQKDPDDKHPEPLPAPSALLPGPHWPALAVGQRGGQLLGRGGEELDRQKSSSKAGRTVSTGLRE